MNLSAQSKGRSVIKDTQSPGAGISVKGKPATNRIPMFKPSFLFLIPSEPLQTHSDFCRVFFFFHFKMFNNENSSERTYGLGAFIQTSKPSFPEGFFWCNCKVFGGAGAGGYSERDTPVFELKICKG